MTNEKNDGKEILHPQLKDFKGTQLDLFQSFLCNTSTERDNLSNAFDLWDSVPRYSVSRQWMEKMRKADSFPQLLSIPFHYRNREFKTVIQPAWVEDENKIITGYYPSANEELIEDALRKIAAEYNQSYFNKNNQSSGVVFTLYMLSEELKKRGHSRSLKEITLSLRILARSSIEIVTTDSKKDKKAFGISAYISRLSAVTKEDITEDSQAKWFVQFHPLVTQAIDTLTYQQFNYAQMMSHSTQLARWLHKLLSLKFTFASLTTVFKIHYSTIKRDSALLENYKQKRQAIVKLDQALNELKSACMLTKIEKNEIRGNREKLEDVIYTLYPSSHFVKEMKVANKRRSSLNTSQDIEV